MLKNTLIKLNKYGQYKYDIFDKLNFTFISNSKLLDLGSGDGSDSIIFRDVFNLDVSSCDIYEHESVKKYKLNFKLAGIYDLPYENNTFDYVFLHDVLHHIDEENQDFKKHKSGLLEAIRVLKPGGYMIIVEGNRFNPLFYPHMVRMLGHNHFTQSYFKKLILESLGDNEIKFKFFEAHLYPQKYLKFWKFYEFLMETFCPKQFLAYNVAIIKKVK